MEGAPPSGQGCPQAKDRQLVPGTAGGRAGSWMLLGWGGKRVGGAWLCCFLRLLAPRDTRTRGWTPGAGCWGLGSGTLEPPGEEERHWGEAQQETGGLWGQAVGLGWGQSGPGNYPPPCPRPTQGSHDQALASKAAAAVLCGFGEGALKGRGVLCPWCLWLAGVRWLDSHSRGGYGLRT